MVLERTLQRATGLAPGGPGKGGEGIDGKDLFAGDVAVKADGTGTHTTIQAALDALPTGGGRLYLEGTFVITAAITLPDKPVTIFGAGPDAAVVDIDTNAIAAFEIGFDREYEFKDFTILGNGLGNQEAFEFTASGTKKCRCKNLVIGDPIGTADQMEKIFKGSGFNRVIECESVRAIIRTTGAPRLADIGGTHIYRDCDFDGAAGVLAVVAPRMLAVNTIFDIGSIASLAGDDSIFMGCFFRGSTNFFARNRNRFTNCSFTEGSFLGVGSTPAFADIVVHGCYFSTSSASCIRATGSGTSQLIVTGCNFDAYVTEAIFLGPGTDCVISGNRNCKVTESGATDRNRYWDITQDSTIIGSSSVVQGIKTGVYTGDGTTSQVITVGFQPRYVRVWRRETLDGDDTFPFETTPDIVNDNASGGSISIKSSGQFSINRLIVLTATGFTVDDAGADEDPNTSGQVYNFWAEE